MKIISTLVFLFAGLGIYDQQTVESVTTKMGIRCNGKEIKCTFRSERIEPDSTWISKFPIKETSPKSFSLEKDLSNSEIKIPGSTSNQNPGIILRCGSSKPEKPLVVIDGVPVPNNVLQYLKPDDIESIWILKTPEASAIYGIDAFRGAIIITTKASGFLKFTIKDYVDNSYISGATVSFIFTDRHDTVMCMSNDQGRVMNCKVKPGDEFVMIVSTVGYRSLVQYFTSTLSEKKEQVLLLERDYKINDEIFISSHPLRTIGCGWGYARTVSKKNSRKDSVTENPMKNYSQLKIFPNPVPKGGILNITNISGNEGLVYRLFDPQGRLLRSGVMDPLKDFNQIPLDPRWSSGLYLVEVYEKDRVRASGKVLIQ